MCNNLSAALRCFDGLGFGDPLGFFYDGPGKLSDMPVVVPPYTTTTTDIYLMRTLAKWNDLLVIFAQELTYNVSEAKVNGTMTVSLGELSITIFFEEAYLPIYLNWSMWPR